MSSSVGSGSDVTPPGVPDSTISSIESTGMSAANSPLPAPATPIDTSSAPAGLNPVVSPRNPFEQGRSTSHSVQQVPPSTAPKAATEASSARSAGPDHGALTPPRPMTEPRKNMSSTRQHHSSPDQMSRNNPPNSPSHSVHSNSIGNHTPGVSPAGAPRHVDVPNNSALQIPGFGPTPSTTSEQRRRLAHPTNLSATATPPTNRVQLQMHSPVRDDLHMRPPIFDDDETTEPSSAGNTAEREEYPDRNNSTQTSSVTGSVVKFFENTRKRLSTSRNPEDDEGSDDDDDDGPIAEGAQQSSLICGSLQKLGRNGKWQMRWFETDGECLSYYKSIKRNKLLATLDLAKVGAILIDEEDQKGQSFTIQVLGRLYLLRADSKASCKDWVITLNRIKEARLQQGHIKLVNPTHRMPVDLLDHHTAPRVVVVANRERTRAVAETVEWDHMINDPAEPQQKDPTPSKPEKRLSTIGTVVLARWTKRRSSMSRLSAKLAKWARSLRKYSCTEIESEGVYLDRHVHPPGHDDKKKRSMAGPASTGMSESSIASSDDGLSGWIGKETSRSSRSAPDDTEGTESRPSIQPQIHRALSVVSEDEARMLS